MMFWQRVDTGPDFFSVIQEDWITRGLHHRKGRLLLCKRRQARGLIVANGVRREAWKLQAASNAVLCKQRHLFTDRDVTTCCGDVASTEAQRYGPSCQNSTWNNCVIRPWLPLRETFSKQNHKNWLFNLSLTVKWYAIYCNLISWIEIVIFMNRIATFCIISLTLFWNVLIYNVSRDPGKHLFHAHNKKLGFTGRKFVSFFQKNMSWGETHLFIRAESHPCRVSGYRMCTSSSDSA